MYALLHKVLYTSGFSVCVSLHLSHLSVSHVGFVFLSVRQSVKVCALANHLLSYWGTGGECGGFPEGCSDVVSQSRYPTLLQASLSRGRVTGSYVYKGWISPP